jgi:hypothetical protein
MGTPEKQNCADLAFYAQAIYMPFFLHHFAAFLQQFGSIIFK